jgi:ABC-type nitrate/sulfonate/bicarbonate transport system substrate-binding protein
MGCVEDVGAGSVAPPGWTSTPAAGPPVSRFTSDQFAALLAEHRFGVVERSGTADVEARWALSALAIGNERVVLASSAS